MRAHIRLVLVGLALLLLGAAAGLWIAFNETAARWVAQRLVAASDGRLAIGEVRGSLAGGLVLTDLRYHDESVTIALDRIAADWSARALLRREARIRRLTVGTLRLTVATATGPAQLPTDLSLPFFVEIEEGSIEAVHVEHGGQRLRIDDVRFRFTSHDAQHDLALTHARLSQGSLHGRLTLGAAAPFGLTASLAFQPASPGRVPAVETTWSGNLAAVTARVRAEGEAVALSGEAAFTPFDAEPLASLALDVKHLALHAVLGTGPRAALSGELKLNRTAPQTFDGVLQARNSDAGPLSANKLPITTLSASLRGNAAEFALRDIVMRLTGEAAATGDGAFAHGRLDLRLGVRQLDLKSFHDRMHPTRLGGSLRLRIDAEGETLSANLVQADYRVELDARRRGEIVEVSRARTTARGGTLELSGTASLAAPHAVHANGKLFNFDPSAFADVPHARVNAVLSVDGHLLPEWLARVAVEASGTGPHGQRFAFDAAATVQSQRLSDAHGALRSGRNEVTFTGNFGAPGDALHLDGKLHALAQLDRRFAGAVAFKARLSGHLLHPAVRLEASGTNLSAPGGVQVRRVVVDAVVPDWRDGLLELKASAQDLRWNTTRLTAVTAALNGTPAAHAATFTASGPDLDLAARLDGGVSSPWVWAGRIAELGVRRPIPLRLEAPASVRLARDGVSIDQARLTADAVRVEIEKTVWTPATFSSSGRVRHLAIAPFLPKSWSEVRSHLIMSGDWNIDQREGLLNAKVGLSRQGGDVALTGETELQLGLSEVSLNAEVIDNRVQASARVIGAQASRLEATIETQMTRRASAWVIAPDAPFALQLTGKIPALDWLGPLVHPALSLSGTLDVRATGRGTFGAPDLEGTIEGHALAARIPRSGMSLGDGRLVAQFTGETLLVREFTLKGGEGQLSAEGTVKLAAPPRADLKYRAERLELMNRRDGRLVISGSGAVTLDKGGLRVAGRTEVQRAEITLLRDADAPVLAGDVRIKGRKPPAETRARSRVNIDMDVDFGNHFLVKASNLEARGSSGPALLAGGFQSRIAGAIRITSDEAGIPQARGTLRLVDGTYTALGQRLEVVRGTLTFSGPLDNPEFDVLAMRTRQAVEAGVEITGSARAPRVRLVSQPEVPDHEKLSWLAFGRGGQNVDRTMTSVSQLSSPVASFGMQLTRNLYVAYEQSTTGASETMRIYTRLTDHIALQARAGGVSSFHVFYNFTLDRPPRPPLTVPTVPR